MGLTWLVLDKTNAAHDLARDLNNDNESDRAIAIVAASYLNLHLRAALERRLLHVKNLPLGANECKDIFKRLFNRGSLSDLSGKIDLCCALGIISPNTHHDLTRIRQVRNQFAHEVESLTFDTQAIADECNSLFSPKKVHVVWDATGEKRLARTPREMYLAAINLITKMAFTETVASPPLSPPRNLPWD